MYIALEYFTDNQDNGYAYNVGDVYPREGYTPTAERIDELSSDKNVRNHAVIGVSDIETETVAEVAAEEPVEEKSKRKRRKREE